jgi:hypothetical protein
VTPALLVLLLTQAKAGGLYDPDPAHPANRIHRAVHTWSGVAPPYDPDGLHWPDRVYHLSGDSQLALGPLLDELLARKAEELLPDPVRRAVLQRDLWMVHDWSEASSRSGERWDVVRKEPAPVDAAAHRELRRKLAAALRHLALKDEQIRALPDACAAAARAWPGAAGEKPGDPFLPADLLDPKGPWVVLSDRSGGPLARAHLEFFGGRAIFLVLLKLPGGRKSTEDYVSRLGGEPPECPAGTQVALVRQMLLLDERGGIVPSSLLEAVQIRVLRPGKDPESHKFVLRRAKLFEGRGGGLVPAGPDDLDRTHLLLLGHNIGPGRGRVLRSCIECHASSSITSLEVVFPIRRPGRAILAPSTREAETDRVHDWCFNRHAFGQLRAAWPD